MKEQDEIEGLLREENAGRVMVGEETVRIIFEAKQYGIDRSQASINDSSSTYIPLMMNNTDINICILKNFFFLFYAITMPIRLLLYLVCTKYSLMNRTYIKVTQS